MLSQFEKPPIIVCVLCRASVSVRKGDKTRFLNHISQDHEVHYDMNLFFALSYMTEQEKMTVVNVITSNVGIDDDGTENSRDVVVLDVEALQKSQEKRFERSLNDSSDTEVLEEDTSRPDVPLIVSTESLEKEDDEDMGDEWDEVKSIINNETATSTETSSSAVNEVKKEREECPQCHLMIPKRAIRIHMKVKHKQRAKDQKSSRKASCQECVKSSMCYQLSKTQTHQSWNVDKEISISHKYFRQQRSSRY